MSVWCINNLIYNVNLQVIHNDGVQESKTGEPLFKKGRFTAEEDKPTIVESIVEFLEKTKNGECQLTCIRALR